MKRFFLPLLTLLLCFLCACGEEPAHTHTPGPEATCTEPQLCSKCGAVLQKALGHDYKEEVTAPHL